MLSLFLNMFFIYFIDNEQVMTWLLKRFSLVLYLPA
jgi:hypothetical protein